LNEWLCGASLIWTQPLPQFVNAEVSQMGAGHRKLTPYAMTPVLEIGKNARRPHFHAGFVAVQQR
jgi:hypothetical protein